MYRGVFPLSSNNTREMSEAAGGLSWPRDTENPAAYRRLTPWSFAQKAVTCQQLCTFQTFTIRD
jgi:hypothetical protein